LWPYLIIYPHALPPRQTIGHLVECLIGKVGLQYGAFNDCTAFNNEGSKVALFGEVLSRTGYHSSGNEIFYDGMSGQQVEMEIFVGPNYYMRLKHMVKDKINYRAKGPRSALTRQTVGGRANDGGLRIGEMERDVLIAHGINHFLNESLMTRGDEYQMVICNKTGLMAIYNPAKKQFLSPAVDGPLQFHINETDRSMTLSTISQFGRSFSVVSIPYSLKLLMQELQAINVHMRIITEDNINQFESMSYSDNLQRLTLDKDMTPQKLAEQIKDKLKGREKPQRSVVSAHTPTPDEISPPYPAVSPAYQADSSPPYPADSSPPYPAVSPAYQADSSPPYPADSSPPYPAVSPAYDAADPQDDSPVYIPNNPSMLGGGHHIDDFSIGNQVYFRGSSDLQIAPDQVWTVTRKGQSLLTIQCPPEFVSNESNGEYIQMAKPNELILYNSPQGIQFRQLKLQQPQQPQQPYQQPTQYSHVQPYNQAPPTIQVTPVIKIMNGNNNTMKEDTPSVETTPSNNGEPTFVEFMGGSSSSDKQKKERKVGGSSEPKEEKTSFVGGFGSAIADFGKLVINKLG
jgi:hypothetical protein